MKKKVLAILLIIAIAVAGISAKGVLKKDDFSLGLNLGTHAGLGFRYGMGDFDLTSNIAFSFIEMKDGNFFIEGDVGALWQVADLVADRNNHFPVSIGGNALFGLNILKDGNFAFTVAPIFMAGIEYPIPEVPLTVYFRAGLGPSFTFGSSEIDIFNLTGAAYLGLVYNFER